MALLTREDLEARERAELAPYARRAGDSAGRFHPEEEHPWRTAYQRDRDRIIHCAAFRRLEYKTQVFVNREGDHYRTRLTHTIEVVHTALAVARPLRLNPELTESIALAHDLGHTPFGHAGEEALNEAMAGHGGFEHNTQSLRLVCRLEHRYPAFRGLNLTAETLGGLVKYDLRYPVTAPPQPAPARVASLEARLADLADTLAYTCSDLEDGLRAGVLDFAMLAGLELWETVQREIAHRYGPVDDDVRVHQSARLLKNHLIVDLVRHSHERLRAAETGDRLPCGPAALGGAGDSRPPRPSVAPGGGSSGGGATPAVAPPEALDFRPAARAALAALRALLYEHFYCHYRVLRMQQKARRIVRELFDYYRAQPRALPPHQYAQVEADGVERAVADYLAGMTDRYAGQEYRKLFDPFVRE